MHSLISIIDMVLTGKENYREWYRNIKSTLIFNDLWKGICEVVALPRDNKITEEEVKSEEESSVLKKKSSRPRIKPIIMTTNKECQIWEDKDQKAYAVIFATLSEEVSRHIPSISDSYGAFKRLNELYDTHYELELIQLMLNLFNLELKNDDLVALASEITAVMHDIEAIRTKIDLHFRAFIKPLYLTYSHYLELSQAGDQMKSMTFEKLANKVVDRKKAFGKKPTPSIGETIYLS
jgi:hypothetical protein